MTRPLRAWWEGAPFAALLLLGAAVPLLWPAIPPLVDLPGHMGGYQVALHGADHPLLARYYAFHWALIGNLGVDLLVVPLGHLIGVEAATKLVVLLIPVTTVAGFLLVAREVHGRVPPTIAFAVPLAWAYPLHYGFVNFCLSVGCAFVGLGLWLWLGRLRRPRLRAVLFVAVALAVWVAHAIGWVMLGAMIGAAELEGQHRRDRRPVAALGRTVLACLPLLAPLVPMALAPGAGARPGGWFEWATMVKWTAAVLRDRWLPFDLASLALLALVLALGIAGRAGLRLSPRAGWPAAALFALFVLAPQQISGSDFVAARLLPYAIALALIGLEATGERRRLVAMLALAFCAMRLAGNTASLLIADRSYRATLAELDAVPPGARIAVFAAQGCRPSFANWGNSRLQHLGGIALVRRDAFVNDQWSIPGLQLLQVHYPAAAPFLAEPSEVVTLERCARPGVRYLPDALAALPRRAFDYIWLLDVPPGARPAEGWLRPLAATDASALYAVQRS